MLSFLVLFKDLKRATQKHYFLHKSGKWPLSYDQDCKSVIVSYRGNHDRQICDRSDGIFLLDIRNTSYPDNARWLRVDASLSQAKSSHDLLRVPDSYCKRALPAQ